jgi:pimeloyl-ACP methyl ester carboxylesterase
MDGSKERTTPRLLISSGSLVTHGLPCDRSPRLTLRAGVEDKVRCRRTRLSALIASSEKENTGLKRDSGCTTVHINQGLKSGHVRASGPTKLSERTTDHQMAPEIGGTCDHLVVLVHGINTRALWMSDVKPALESAGFTVGQTSYGRFSILRFLAPFRWLRNKAISRVAMDIRTARRAYKIAKGNDPKMMSVISHSFGTYVVGRLLTDYPDFQWYRIIFCGSVVREDFPLHQVLERFAHPLLNEIGTKDYLPALAESAGWGYGSVGSTGFNRPPVETRWHHGYSHSNFLTEEFCKEFWIPFLQGHSPKAADKPTQMPLLVRLTSILPLRWAMIACAVAVVFWSARVIEGNAGDLFLSFSDRLGSVTLTTRQEKDVITSPAPTSNRPRPLECFNGLGDCPEESAEAPACVKGLGDCPEKK